MKNKKILIIGAMDCEVELINNLITKNNTISKGNFCADIGTVEDNTIAVTKCGVGKVAAATTTQFFINTFQPDYIINTGIAGGIATNLKIGDIVIADKLVYHDFDATVLGYAKGYICNKIESDKPTWFYTDKNLSSLLTLKAKEIIGENNVHTGVIATGDMFIGQADYKKLLDNLFNATAAEMEAGAIAHCANLNKIPCAIIRTISDLADGDKTDNFEEFEYKSAQTSAFILSKCLI